MNITTELAERTLALIADINRSHPSAGQGTTLATSLDTPPSVETLTALNYGEWIKRLMEEDNWRETEGRLQELVANWIGQYRRRELRHLAKDWVREPKDKATANLFELWGTEDELKRLAQLVTEREFPESRTPVCFAIVNARITVRSVLNFMRHDRKPTPREIAQANLEMEANRDEYDYWASLITADEFRDQ